MEVYLNVFSYHLDGLINTTIVITCYRYVVVDITIVKMMMILLLSILLLYQLF
jgi:hypothetical protein